MNRMLPKGGVGCVYRCISEVICSPTTHVHLPTTPPCRARADRPCRMAAWQVHQSTMSHGCPHVRADGTQQQQHPAPTATRSHSRSVGSPTRHPRACATHSACHIATSLHRYSGVHRTMRSRCRRLGCNDCAQRLAKDACVDSPNVTRALSIEPPGRLAMQLIQREAPGPTLCGAPCDALPSACL